MKARGKYAKQPQQHRSKLLAQPLRRRWEEEGDVSVARVAIRGRDSIRGCQEFASKDMTTVKGRLR